jgi:PPOX class probable FMN-dependent enzyme
MPIIRTVEELEERYGQASGAAVTKEIDRIAPVYRALIEASRFVVLATSGPEGLDCSPRGDAGEVVRIQDEKTLMLPDWRGNNRVDSLRNIIRQPNVALLFLIAGSGTTLRVNGRAVVSVDPELLSSFVTDGKEPRSVVVIDVETVYFQCSRAVMRAALWDQDKHVKPGAIPTPGQILAGLSQNALDADEYDRSWAKRAPQSLW